MFVPTRKHARLTAMDILAFAAADGQPGRFLQVHGLTSFVCWSFISLRFLCDLGDSKGGGFAYRALVQTMICEQFYEVVQSDIVLRLGGSLQSYP